MSTSILRSPLSWPPTWPRDSHPQAARFGQHGYEEAVYDLERELRLLGAHDLMVTTNLELTRYGQIASRQRYVDADAGVAVWFVRNGQDLCIACDKWIAVVDNIRAITKTVDALRGIDRWGSPGMVDAAFAGFGALPAHATTGLPWWEVLGIAPNATRDEVTLAYRRLVKTAHPDAGGDADRFVQIQQAYEQAVAS